MDIELKIRINEIEALLKNDTYNDYVTAINLMEKNYDWYYNEKEKFTASLLNYNTAKKEYETLHMNTISAARQLFDKINASIIKIKQVEDVLNVIVIFLDENTYNDAKNAQTLLEKKYSWTTDKGTKFSASLSDYNIELFKCINLEKEQEENRRKQEREEQEYENRRQAERTGKRFIFVLILGGIIVAFATGHWILGIIGIFVLSTYVGKNNWS